jgi:transposase
MVHAITSFFPERTIGIDLSDRRSQACVLDLHGKVIRRFSFATTRTALEKTFADQPHCRVALEVGTHSPWMSRRLAEMGHEVIVANARQVQSITQSDRKNDAADAEQLARLARSDPKLLHPIVHRGEEAQRDGALLSVRRQLVAMRVALVVQARGLAKALGERLPRSGPEAFVRRVEEAGQADLFPGLRPLLDTVTHLGVRIRELEKALAQRTAQAYPEVAHLRQVPGVGPITSLSYVLRIEDPRRFDRSRRVGSYVGLQPKQRDSGAQRPQLSISKSGDPELRRLLVQCAQWILARGPDSDLKRFGLRLAQRGGRAAKKKAVIALARKLAVVLHRLWRHGEVYEPLHRATRTEAVMP